jgi:hypothetical protein
MKNSNIVGMYYLISISIFVFALAGWILNLLAIAHANFNDINGLLIIRIIGVFIAPIGAVLGYF